MNEKEYRNNEIAQFRAGNGPFYRDSREFAESMKDLSSMWFLTQLEWIENGSYGAGACFVLRDTWEYIQDNKRCNRVAQIGTVLLSALTGRATSARSWWTSLDQETQYRINHAVVAWLENDRLTVLNNQKGKK